ncbi:MAG: hypothetical protein D6726_11560, partial [Nitrospirae bacterium]
MIMQFVEPIYLIECTFRVTAPVEGLPFYTGPHWSALFRTLYRLLHAQPMPSAIGVIPIETGMTQLDAGDLFTVHLDCPAPHWEPVREMLEAFNEFELRDGHFAPGRSVQLSGAVCRVSGKDALAYTPYPLTEEIIHQTAATLRGTGSLNLTFYTPLRLTRPGGAKTEGHRYVDVGFFHYGGGTVFANSLLNSLRNIKLSELPRLNTVASPVALAWVDTPYGNYTKTIGGIVGRVVLK